MNNSAVKSPVRNEFAMKNIIEFANTKHHRELIKQSVDPRFIEKIEASAQPSLNYLKAFQTTYKFEANESMNSNKGKHKDLASQHKETVEGSSSVLIQSASQSLHQSAFGNPKFLDYEEAKYVRADQYSKNNVNSGTYLFGEQDSYQQAKQRKMVELKRSIRLQLDEKENVRDRERLRKISENKQFDVQMSQVQVERQLKEAAKFEQKLHLKNDLVEMIEQKKQREIRKSEGADLRQRHNPITNPIEYHIENPYILRKMQKNCP